MKLYACHNRPREAKPAIVQDGWITYLIGGNASRLPRMVEIPSVFSVECRYDKGATDPRCTGCAHLPVVE